LINGIVRAGTLILLALVAAHAHAQTLTVLASLDGSSGNNPCGRLTLVGNTLYGTALVGGVYGYGTVFSVPVSGGSPTVLTSFNGNNGAEPYGGLILDGNTLYGTTGYGDIGFNGDKWSGYGEVFALNLNSTPSPPPSPCLALAPSGC
jgi:uncharacterized repeat protein (TIGR03803 family)